MTNGIKIYSLETFKICPYHAGVPQPRWRWSQVRVPQGGEWGRTIFYLSDSPMSLVLTMFWSGEICYSWKKTPSFTFKKFGFLHIGRSVHLCIGGLVPFLHTCFGYQFTGLHMQWKQIYSSMINHDHCSDASSHRTRPEMKVFHMRKNCNPYVF